MRIERRLLVSTRPAAPQLALTILLGLGEALITILQALLLSRIVTGLYLRKLTLVDISPLLIRWIGLALLRAPFHIARSGAAQAAASEIKGRLRARLTSTLVQLGPQWLSNQRSGELLNTLTSGIEALDAYIGGYLPQLALGAIVPLIMLIFLLPIDLISGLVLLVTAPLIPLFMILIGDTGERMTRQRWRTLGQLNATLLDTLQGLRTLKLLGQGRAQRDRIASASEIFRRSTMDVLRVTFLSALILEWVAMLGTAVVAVEIGLRVLYGRLEFESAFFILLLAPEFYAPLRALGARFHAGMTGFEAAGQIYSLMGKETPAGPVETNLPMTLTHEIKFQRVAFRYQDRDQETLDAISLSLRAGEGLAILGPSGCGKTTLTKLLLRFIEPDSGQVLVDGRPLKSIDPGIWRDQIAWMPQNPHLFSTSAFENIRLARPTASHDQVIKAARAAGIHQDLLALPDGYETPLGERGLRLSAGQIQRVALARAFLKDSPILVLDEATANLDPLTEASLLTALEDLLTDRTAFVITHRLETARLVRHVILMNAGRIIQSGTHAELLAQEGPYAELVRASRAGQ